MTINWPPGYTEENVANKSTDVTLGGMTPSDILYPSQKAAKTYVDAFVGVIDALIYKGAISCSGNPNYPAADAGHVYWVSTAGKIGGVSGINIEVGDLLLCKVDSSATGTQAVVGGNWDIVQVNIDGAVVGPASVTDGTAVLFDQTTGKLIKASTLTGIIKETAGVPSVAGAGTDFLVPTGDASLLTLTPPATSPAFAGPTVSATAGEALVIGNSCYQGPDDKWWKAFGNIPAVWVGNTVYAVGSLVRRTNNVQDFFYFCSAVTSDAKSAAVTEPTWPTTIGGAVVDNHVTWTCIGTQSIVARRIACGTINAGATGTFLIWGHLRNDAWSALTPGTPLWLDPSTPGAFTVTTPATAGNLAQIIGRITGAGKTIFFNPDWTNVQV